MSTFLERIARAAVATLSLSSVLLAGGVSTYLVSAHNAEVESRTVHLELTLVDDMALTCVYRTEIFLGEGDCSVTDLDDKVATDSFDQISSTSWTRDDNGRPMVQIGWRDRGVEFVPLTEDQLIRASEFLN